LSQFSNLGASCSKKLALDTPQDKNPRRLASDFMKSVYFDFGSINLKIIIKSSYEIGTFLALMEVASHAF